MERRTSVRAPLTLPSSVTVRSAAAHGSSRRSNPSDCCVCTCLSSAGHMLLQGRGWKPSWKTRLNQGTHARGAGGVLPEALLNQPLPLASPLLPRPQSQGHACALAGSALRFAILQLHTVNATSLWSTRQARGCGCDCDRTVLGFVGHTVWQVDTEQTIASGMDEGWEEGRGGIGGREEPSLQGVKRSEKASQRKADSLWYLRMLVRGQAEPLGRPPEPRWLITEPRGLPRLCAPRRAWCLPSFSFF